MSHEVFRLIELKQKLSYKIESIATTRNLFFLGTNDGKLVVYEVSRDNYDAQCIHIHTSKHKQPIRAIFPIIEKEILIAVAGDVIVIHRLQHMSHTQLDRLPEDRLAELSTIKGVKDVISLHIKRHKGIFTMAVLQRKKVTIYEYKDHLQEFVLVKDGLQLPEGAKTLLWVGKNIIIGFRREYVLLDVSSGASDCLYPAAPPLLISLDPVPELLIGAEGTTGLRALHDGSLVPGKSGLPWPSPPTSLAYTHPFLITTHDNNCMEVRVPFLSTLTESSNPSLCQSISMKYADRISQRPFADFDARLPTRETPSDALRKDIIIVINSSNTVYLLDLIPLREQVAALTQAKRFEAGLILCQLCANEVEQTTVENLKTQYALWNFIVKRDFKSAMLRFHDINVDPRIVINLFPGFLTQRARETWRPPKEFIKSLDTAADLAQHMQDAVAAFLDYAVPLRWEYFTSSKSSKNTDAKLLSEAIDTAIMKAYVVMGQEQQLLQFLSEENTCSLLDSEVFLADSEQWVALAVFWYYHKQYNKIFLMLYTLGLTGKKVLIETLNSSSPNLDLKFSFDNEFLKLLEKLLPEVLIVGITSSGVSNNNNNNSNSNNNIGFTPQSVLTKYLVSITVGVEKNQLLYLQRRCVGVITTIQYVRLLSLEDQEIYDLVKRYTKWILANISPQWSMKMFPVSIMKLLQQKDILHLISSDMSELGNINLQERVITWISLVFGDNCNKCTDTDIHNAYWRNLMLIIFSESNIKNEKEDQERNQNDIIISKWRRCLDEFLRDSQYINIKDVKEYLEQSNIRTLTYTERAIIYKRLKLHEESIRMFLYEAKELQEAQNYVTQVSHESGENDSDAFRVLLKLLLLPNSTDPSIIQTPLLKDAITIINTCEGADPLIALPMLPDNTPLIEIAEFMKRSIRDASTRSLNAEIYANILESRIRQAELTLARERSRRVVMDLDSCCGVCGKKLRPDTVFMYFPNGVVVHQACMDDEHVCPVTHNDFRRGLEQVAREKL